MRGASDGWFVMLAAGAIALGIGIHFVITGGKGEGGSSEARPPSRSGSLLADPSDPRAIELRERSPALDDPDEPTIVGKRLVPPPPEVPPTDDDDTDSKHPGTLGDLGKLGDYKEALKSKARAGKASDPERRMLRALCRQLGDTSCSN